MAKSVEGLRLIGECMLKLSHNHVYTRPLPGSCSINILTTGLHNLKCGLCTVHVCVCRLFVSLLHIVVKIHDK